MPITLELKPSVLLCLALAGFGGFCVLAVVVLPLPPAVILLATLGLALAVARAVYRHALLRLADAVVRLQLLPESGLQLTWRDGRREPATVLASRCFVAAWLTVLQLRVESQRGPVVLLLLPDNAAAQDFRALRVWLLWGRKRASDVAPVKS